MSVVYFLLLVGVLVSVHELGHFAAAKLVGVRVLRFSLGFGPAVARVRGRETEYQIGVIPLGGYVKMLGEDPAEEVPEAERARAFSGRPLWQRLIVVFAGPAANLLCPFLIYFAFYARHTEVPAAVIGDVLAGGPAAAAELAPGDEILAIDGAPIRYWEELEQVVDRSIDRTLRFRVRRGGRELDARVAPRRHVLRSRDGERDEQGLIGVTQAPFLPYVGVLDAASPAARAGLTTGDRIIGVDGRPVGSWTELSRALGERPKRAALAYLRPRRARLGFADLRLAEPGLADLVPDTVVDPDGRRRVETGLSSAELIVARVEPGSPAAAVGLRAGDLIESLDGQPVSHWLLLDQALMADPERAFTIGWRRARPGGGTEVLRAALRQEHRRVRDEFGHEHVRLVFGAASDLRPGQGRMVPVDGRFAYAAAHAFGRTGMTIAQMVRGLGSLLRGDSPRDAVGGPIMMYRIASVSGAQGWDAFLLMIALISINLGLLNLLPIPVLDGGHLLIFAVEAVRRRRLSTRVREAVVLVGLALIVALTILALKNDIVRYLLDRGGA